MQAVQRCSDAGARSLQCCSDAQCCSGHLLLAKVQAVEAVQAVQRCFQEDVQQGLDA